MTILNKYIVLINLFLFSFLGVIAQEFKNEEDRRKHADKLFDKGKYEEAAPHMLHFYSLDNLSPEYSFKYGVCLMYTEEDKEKSVSFLRFSASKGGGGDSRVYFFLGKSYHLNYNFKEALINYQKFKQEGEENYKEDLQVDMHIKMCKNGKQLLKNLTELVVYEKTESSFERFQYSYKLKEIGGSIIVSSEFQSKYDKKVGYKSVVYLPPLNQDILFFSSYGKDGSTGLDLYLVKREASGGFGSPQKLPESINTPYDDAYGFLHADGKSFYFSSKGHTSMGGYDVFKVDYEPQTNQFGTPKNLDYKINTPDDDIMYIVDPNFENAYFSSSRAAKGGYLDVYKVKVETFPIVNVILAGKFENKINPEDINATIKVENIQSGEIEGIYNSDNRGNYVIVLPRSGKYKLIVETPKSEKIHTGMIDVPSQKEMRPLKQKLDLVSDAGVEKLVINNLFDQDLENADEILAKVLKAMSDPDPNADNFPDSLYAKVDKENVVGESLGENYSVDDLIGLSSDKATEIQEEANALKKRMEAAYTVANKKSNSAKELTKQANATLKEIESITSPLEKQEKVELAKKAHAQSKDLNLLATTALNLANALKKEYDKKQAEASDAKNVALEIEKAVNEDSHDKAIAALKDLQSRIDELIEDKPDYKSGFDKIVQDAKLKQEEADKANLEAQEFRTADDELNMSLTNLKRDLEKAKNKDKPLIQRQIDDIKEQLILNDEMAKESFAKSNEIQKEADVLNHQVDLMSNLFDDIETADNSVELSEEEKKQIKDYLASNELEDNISENEKNLNQFNDGTTSETLENKEVDTNLELTEVEKEEVIADTESEFQEFQDGFKSLEGESNTIEYQEQKKEILGNWVKGIETKIDETTAELANTTDSKEKLELTTKLTWLNNEKLEKETEISNTAETLASLENSNATDTSTNAEDEEVVLTEQEKVAVIAAEKENYISYENELSSIDQSKTDLEVATAKKKINEDWVTALDGEIMDTEDQIALESDPKEKKIAEEKLAWLNDQKAEKEIDLNFIEEELSSYSEVVDTSINETPTITNVEKESLIAEEKDKFKSFEDKMSALGDNNDLKNLEEKTSLVENWIVELDSQLDNAETAYLVNTDDKKKLELATKIDWLKNEKTKKTDELINYNNSIASLKEDNSIDSTLITKENEKAEDWLGIIEADISDLELKIENEDDENVKAELIDQKEKLIDLKNEKLNLVEVNTNIVEKSTEQKELEESDEFKELVEELENTSYTPRDYETSFSNNLNYKSDKANELIKENSTKVDELLIVEQEIEQLETQLVETQKEKKKLAIQSQIEKKTDNKVDLELAISDNIELIDKAEFEENNVNLEKLIAEAKDLNNKIINDQNYQSAKLLEEKYIAQNNEAKELLNEAKLIEDKLIKAEKVKEAHAIQQAAISNQVEATTLIKEMISTDYEPTLIGEKEELLVNNSTEEIRPEDELISLDYLSNQKSTSLKLTEEFNTIPNEEKQSFLKDWKDNVDIEINKNLKLLTSDIPDKDKEVISENINYLRNEQQEVLDKQNEVSNLAINNDVVIDQPIDTITENNSVVNDDTTNVASNEITNLSTQKEIFEDYELNLSELKTTQEKVNLYEEWINKLDEEISTNKELITGNITVDEEAVIQSKIEWLEEEKALKTEGLFELKSKNLVDNSNEVVINTVKVPQEVIDNSKVSDEVAGISFYSANDELSYYEVSTNVETESLTNQLEYNSNKGNEIIEENKSKINKVKNYETIIESLETQKEETTDEKFIKSVDKKIDKASVKKSKAELKLSEDFKNATAEDNILVNSNLDETKNLLPSNVDENSYAFKQAKEYEVKAKDLKSEADQLRNKAVEIKSVTEKSAIIDEALSKEKESIEYKKKASKLYSEAIVNAYSIDENTLSSVSENENERPSKVIIEAANKADNLAYEYETRALELSDSALTVKKKNRSKVIQEAEVYTQKSEAQKVIAKALKEEASKVKEREAIVLENDLLITNLSEKDVEEVRSTKNYDKVYNNQLAIDAFLEELKKEEEMMNSYKSIANQQENKAIEYKERAKNTTSEVEKEELNSIADQLLEKAKENRSKQDSIEVIIVEINNNKEAVDQQQFDLLSQFDEEVQNDIKGLFLSNYEKTPKARKEVVIETPTLALENLTSSKFEAPEVLNTNIVVINNDRENSVYSESNPIPVNPKNPKGLVYKVQVGAFRKAIPQDLFKGFAPISAEKINDDITRYRVGYFVNFGTANVSKNQIRKIGYPDAFVVAILDGKRIGMAEARAYANNPNTEVLAVNTETQIPDNNNQNDNTTTDNTTTNNDLTDNTSNENNSTTNQENNTNTETEIVPDYVQNLDENAAEVNAVESIKGLFYTVQVGAFSKPISKTGAFNISPLVTKYVNGLYKYTTGIYKSVANADGRKNEVRAKGIPDAFVIAYYNGERVSMLKATQIIQEQGEAAFATKAEGENIQPRNNVNDSEEINLNEGNSTDSETPEINSTRVVPELAKLSYLSSQKSESQALENELEAADLENKKKVLVKWNTRIEKELDKNVKLLALDIPDSEKEVISDNLVWLRADKIKVKKKEEEINKEIEANSITENSTVETEETRIISEFAKPSYLESQKEESIRLEENLKLIDNGTKKQILNERNSRIEEELSKNTKLLDSDIPEAEKEVISKNVVWLRAEKAKIKSVKDAIYREEGVIVKPETPIENEVEIEDETRVVSKYAKTSYLTNQKSKSSAIDNQLSNASLSEKNDLLVNWSNALDTELNENMKLLVSDIPEVEKEVINDNVTWIRSEKAKVKKSQIELINEAQVTDPLIDNSSTKIEENDIEKKSTFYVDLGIYYGTVPTPIAEALLTNRSAKVKRNKINASATQYYCGVFLTLEEVAGTWASFIEQGLTDAKIVEIKYDQEFILMEKDEDNVEVENKTSSQEDENLITAINTKLVYRVELGTFDGSVPTTKGRVFLELGYLGVERIKSNNKDTYYCGKVDSEAKANELKQKFIEKGITEAKTVAFVGERKISLSEAKELSK